MTKAETNPKSENRKPTGLGRLRRRLAEAGGREGARTFLSAGCVLEPEVQRADRNVRAPSRSLRPSGFGFVSGFGLRTSAFRAFALLLFFLPTLLRAADTNAVLAAWLAAQTNVSTWSAEFIQTRSLKALNQPLVSTGRVWFAKPNRFRWELGQPAQTIAVRDEELLQVIYPRLKRAERYPLADGKSGPLGEALGLLDAGFPRSRADFDARFRVASLETINGAWCFGLQPATASARRMLPSIQVTLEKKTFLLLANELVFPDGSRMRNDFSNPTLNAAFAPDVFKPALGDDFKVVAPPTQ